MTEKAKRVVGALFASLHIVFVSIISLIRFCEQAIVRFCEFLTYIGRESICLGFDCAFGLPDVRFQNIRFRYIYSTH